jgi:hypothetical protein
MPQESLGFVKLEWTCPNCKTRNPGPQKACSGCGSVQPPEVKFEQQQQEELIKDQAEIEKARAGADIICPYCQARNPAGSKACLGCGGDLGQAQRREAGAVLGAHRDQPAAQLACPACGEMSPANTMRCPKCGSPMVKPTEQAAAAKPGCSRWMIALGVGVLALIIILIVMLTRTSDVVGKVQAVAWTRAVPILEMRDVSEEAWRDQVPADGRLGSCQERAYGLQDNPPSSGRYETVCGTPYTVDTGSGFGEVKQDCQYQVYKDYCQYTVKKWVEVNRLTATGSDLDPAWPGVSLGLGQQEGQRLETYQVTFNADGKNYKYTTEDYNLFVQFKQDSTWTLTVNALDAVIKVTPTSTSN